MEQTALQVQEVDFQGATLLAVRDNDNKVWAGVKWVCQGIGLSEGQQKAERIRIQSDFVLKEGGRNLVLPTNSGNQEVLCILIDFVPLWLAKISITPTMQRETPEIARKLKEYQLKAKDVLAAAFLPDTLSTPPQNNPTNCTILNDTIQVLQSMQKSLIDCSLEHGYILQDHEKQFDDVYEEIKSLENVIEMKNTDLRDEIQNEFYHINETIEKLKAIKRPTMSVVSTVQHPTGKALAHSIIKPLAEARNDITKGYNYTYRLVYSEMGVSWNNRLSRYANKHKSKNKPSKINLLVSDSKLLSLFEDTVNRLLSEFHTQEVEHEEDC